MNLLEGKTAVITGAKGGLGSYVTEAFLAAGATVAGVSRSIQPSDFGNSRFVAIPAELSTREAAQQLAMQASERLGRIDILVHLMGGFAGGKNVEATDDATLGRLFDLNFRSAFQLIGAIVPRMREQGSGRILAIGSRAALEPSAGAAAYSASKAALVALIRAVAAENADRSVSANIVLPGTMDTPGNRAADPAADHSRWVQPSQVAAMLVHLASDSAGQVSGAVIPVYGREL